MIMVNLKGGLGNQMFQYSLYTKLQLTNKNVILDTTQIRSEMDRINRGTIFDTFVLEEKSNHDFFSTNSLYKSVRKKFCKSFHGIVAEKKVGKYDPEILSAFQGYLDGYWQSYKYFSDIRDLLLKRFEFKNYLTGENLGIYNKILNSPNSISLHVRLGDYLLNSNTQKLYGGICTIDYYRKAIEMITAKFNSPSFYIFSNEPREAIKILPPNISYTVVDANDEKNAWADLFLMKTCKHNIIANSSFSWWGAWLNENPGKSVIAPNKFINGITMPDICPQEWVQL